MWLGENNIFPVTYSGLQHYSLSVDSLLEGFIAGPAIKLDKEAFEAMFPRLASILKRAIKIPRAIIPSNKNKVKSRYFEVGVR